MEATETATTDHKAAAQIIHTGGWKQFTNQTTTVIHTNTHPGTQQPHQHVQPG